MTYYAYITRIVNVRKHPNADRLLLGECFNNQVVVGLDTKEGELGIYFPSDGRISIEFLKANNQLSYIDEVTKERKGGFFSENGKVRTQKFRKERSDGFFCPLSYLYYTGVDYNTLIEGLKFTEINGHEICKKYTNTVEKSSNPKPYKVVRIKYPQFAEHKDTEQLVYNLDKIPKGACLYITEKLHGTSGRTSNTLVTQLPWYGRIINSLFKRTIIEPKPIGYKYVSGTRRVTIADMDSYGGGFDKADKNYRVPAHNLFVGKLHEGETVYYEIVGWSTDTKPIMNRCDNRKLEDKEFVKQYGKETVFSYNQPEGTSEVYVYRITHTDADGWVKDYTWQEIRSRCRELDVKTVPLLTVIVYDEDSEKLINLLENEKGTGYAQGASTLCDKHIREGVVVRINSSKWEAWKFKSFEFKVLEDIIKLSGAKDTEEES